MLKRYALTIIGAALGAIAGYLYYYYVGCANGNCAITSRPLNSTLYGGLMGGLLFTYFRTTKTINNMTIIDVRSPEEYKSGHVGGSVNIPLQEIENYLNEIKNFNKPIILCCASGNRSEQATDFLRRQGVPCANGGAWIEIRGKL
jgi:phage shock protein E